MTNPIINLLNQRYASRSIATTALSDEAVRSLTEAARLTPSCFNKQPWRFVFATSEQGRNEICKALSEGNQTWACRAPLLIVGHTRPQDDCQLPDGRQYHEFDLGMAVMNIMLAATAQDLVARPMAGFDTEAIRKACQLDDDTAPLVVVAIGMPSSDTSHLPERMQGVSQATRERRPTEEIVTFA